MSIRKTPVLRGKVRAINLNLEDTAMEVAFKTLGPEEIFDGDNGNRKGEEC